MYAGSVWNLERERNSILMRRTKKQKLLYYTRPHFYKKVLADLEEVEEKVCMLLSKDEHLRNCDTCLVYGYWKEVHRLMPLDLRWISIRHTLTSFETIRRVRQYIQNELHLWEPTDQEVIEKRSIKQEAMKEWAISKQKIFNQEEMMIV